VGRRLGQQQNVAVVGFTIASLGALGKNFWSKAVSKCRRWEKKYR
jgi:hypothetical protein